VFPVGHDPNDYEIGKRVGLETINTMNKDGSLNAAAGALQSLQLGWMEQAGYRGLHLSCLLVRWHAPVFLPAWLPVVQHPSQFAWCYLRYSLAVSALYQILSSCASPSEHVALCGVSITAIPPSACFTSALPHDVGVNAALCRGLCWHGPL
jgi:hypothetical protein